MGAEHGRTQTVSAHYCTVPGDKASVPIKCVDGIRRHGQRLAIKGIDRRTSNQYFGDGARRFRSTVWPD
jgi:hypothetical protein